MAKTTGTPPGSKPAARRTTRSAATRSTAAKPATGKSAAAKPATPKRTAAAAKPAAPKRAAARPAATARAAKPAATAAAKKPAATPRAAKAATTPRAAKATTSRAAKAPATPRAAKAPATPRAAKAATPRAVAATAKAATKTAAATAAPPAGPAEGDTAPAFAMPASGGRTAASEALAGKPYLLYFYPKADTPGCTKQACGMQEALPQLGKIGLTVIGVSPDPIPPIEKFAKKFGLEFPLASDEDHKVAEAYGVWVQKSMYGKTYMGMERSSFLVGADGRIVKVWRKVKPEAHAAQVIEAAQALG